MKKNTVLVVGALALLTASTASFAHGGGLNASGCHNNRKTGGYHCHRSSYTAPSRSPSYTSPSRSTPVYNRKKNDVLAAQYLLKTLGYQVGTTDGVSGNQTRSAIKSFQRAQGLMVSGVVTDQLLAKLAQKIHVSRK